jgi:hypothetical protein
MDFDRVGRGLLERVQRDDLAAAQRLREVMREGRDAALARRVG